MSFKEEITWFNENQDLLKQKYPGQVVVVFNKKVQGAFNDNLSALRYRTENLPEGDEEGDEVLIRSVDHVETINIIPSIFRLQ